MKKEWTILVLVGTLMGCNRTDTGQDKVPPRTSPAVDTAPSFHVTRVDSSAGSAPDLETPLVLTGTIAELNGGPPEPWECEARPCPLANAGKALKLQETAPTVLAVGPEVSALGLVSWMLELGENCPPLLVQGKDGKLHSIPLKPGRIFAPVTSPSTWQHTLLNRGVDGKAKAPGTPSGPAVKVRGGTLNVAETCNDPTLNRATRRELKNLIACYRTYSSQDGPAEGSAHLFWTVDPAGKGNLVETQSDTLKDEALLRCFQESVEGFRYTPFPERGEPCTLDWELTFRQRTEEPASPRTAATESAFSKENLVVQITGETAAVKLGFSGTTVIVSLKDREALGAEVAKSLEKNPIGLVTYQGEVTARQMIQVGVWLHEAGLQDVRLAHPRD